VTRENDFIEYLFDEDIREDRVEVIIMRDGSQETIYIEPVVLVNEYYEADNDPLEHFGIVLDDRYDDRIVVWKVIRRSPAYYAGIRKGDVITTFHGERVAAPKEFVQVVQGLEPGKVEVGVQREQRNREFEVDVPRMADRRERRDSVREERSDRREEVREERTEDRSDRRGDRDDAKERRDQGRSGVLPQPKQ
jgi:predicted metalloprotease with PDZ domain